MIRTKLATALLVILTAGEASAQRVRDHRKLAPAPKITVSAFSPQSGPVGTSVTISGEGFTPKTRVYFGGYNVRPKRVTPTTLTVVVPRRYGDGAILLRHPGIARDIPVGTFSIVAPPTMYGFSPTSGVPGTRVAIRGKRFQEGDTVTLAGRPVPVIRLTSTQITVEIPPDAATGKLAVVRPGATNVSSGGRFTVVQPAPTITHITPTEGLPGQTVRITGEHFTPTDTVRYGKHDAQVVRRSGPNTLEVVIPPHARNSRYLWVRGPGGETSSPARFRLEQPPVIRKIAPPVGSAGDRVEIFGAGFRAGDRVSINGLQCRIIQLRERQISAIIPSGALSGALEVERGTLRAASPQQFEVVYTPTLSNFAPVGGEEGAEVTISGTSLTPDAEVFYGRKKLRILRRHGDISLTVRIPKGAGDQSFTVRTRGGEVTSQQRFQVYRWPQMSAVSPVAAFPGSQVTIIGTHLDQVAEVHLGRTALRILSTGGRGTSMVVEIPHAMRPPAKRRRHHRKREDGPRLSYTAFGRELTTEHRIEIRERPVLTDFAPTSGAPGTEVLVNGQHLTADTRAFFGGTPLEVVSRNLPAQIIVRIPARARGAKHLWIEELDARVRSQHPFAVVARPTITGFIPRAGKPGTQVTIRGGDLSGAVEVLLGDTPCQIVSRPNQDLVVEVPMTAPRGKQYFAVRQGQLSSRAKMPFRVLPVAYIERFEPTQGPPGTEVVLYGRDFNHKTRAFFGDIELQVLGVARRGTEMRVALPPNVTGSALLSVEDEEIRSSSSSPFRVLQPPPPRGGVKVRDHRKRQ